MSTNSTLIVKRVIDADRKTIFKALTDEKIMEKWFFAGEDGWSATVEANVVEGGNYKIDMHSPENTYWHKGEFKEVVPNEKIVLSWNSMAVTDTLVTITLEEVENGTEVKLTHTFLPNAEMKKNHAEGWTQILARLEEIVLKHSA